MTLIKDTQGTIRCRINAHHVIGGKGFLNVQMYHPSGYYDPSRGIFEQRKTVDEIEKTTNGYISLATQAGWTVKTV